MKKTTSTTTATVAYTGDIPNTPLRFLLHISKPHKWWAFGAIACVMTAATLGVMNLYVLSRLIDDFAGTTNTNTQLEVLFYWSVIFFTVTVIERSIWRVSGFLGIKWLVDAHATGFKTLYDYLTNHSHSYFINRFAGALTNKVANAVNGSVDLAERWLWNWAPEFIALIPTIILFWLIHWSLAVVLLIICTLIFFFNLWFARKRRPHVIAYSNAVSKARGEGVDLITNIAAARQFAHRTWELKRYDKAIDEMAWKDKFQWFMGERLMVVNTIIGVVMTASILVAVYMLLQNNLATAGQLVLILTLLGRVGFLFAMMGNMINAFIRMYGECEEGLDEILIDHEIVDAKGAKKLKAKDGKIDWKDVTFEFGDNTVFDDFKLTITPGQRVGLVGHSGAGKTTFVSLLLRQHDLQDGAIEIDGQNIAKVTQDSLREHIAVVPQEPMLFHRSIKENIAYGKPKATMKEIEAVAKKAQAHEFITDLELGYDTLVGERGVKLSGGQKQRIAIARAMLKDAPILILDEATSALDSESEVEIQKALHKLMTGKTVVAVAHRLSTLREMDRIIVLDKGKIIEDGSHDALVAYGGVYAKLWEHQAGGFLQD